MNDNAIKEVVGLICESRQEGDMVSLTIGSLTGENRLSITNAPSYVLDAITDNGSPELLLRGASPGRTAVPGQQKNLPGQGLPHLELKPRVLLRAAAPRLPDGL